MLMIEYKDIGWWYWLITAMLLTFGVFICKLGFILAICLTVINLINYILLKKSLIAFPVQVRFFYLILLIISLPEFMQWLYWVPTIGTWAQVIVGYCAMARIVSLFPWNKKERLSMSLFVKTFISPPVKGSVNQDSLKNKK